MKTTITPGIWKAILKRSPLFGGKHWYVATEDGDILIARLCGAKGIPKDRSEANARAIACLPELIDTLKLVQSARGNMTLAMWHGIDITVKAVLRKALGDE